MLTDFQIYQCGPGNEDGWTFQQQLAFGQAVAQLARAQDEALIRQMLQALESPSADSWMATINTIAAARAWLAAQPKEAEHATHED